MFKNKNKEKQRLILALFINWSIEIYTLDVCKTTESLVTKGFSAIQNLLRHNLGFQNCIKDGKNIDPPYNTGNDFIYKDKFKNNIENYFEQTGQIDGEGSKYSTNVESSGRFHTDWLNMMYPRLMLAKDLLTDDGVIFISIDENEYPNLRKLMNEIFGENNYRNTILIRRRVKSLNLQFSNNGLNTFNVGAEYIVAYSKSDSFKFVPIEKKIKMHLHKVNGMFFGQMPIDQLWDINY